MAGEMTSLSQPNLTNIVVSPLRHYNCSSKVVQLAASLLSLPFVMKGISEECFEKIKNVTKILCYYLKTNTFKQFISDLFGSKTYSKLSECFKTGN